MTEAKGFDKTLVEQLKELHPNEKFTIPYYVNDLHPKYTFVIFDNNPPQNLTTAVFVVPQGSENEYHYATDDGNKDLVEAISLGHDLGHTPFGHCGEGVLNELVKGGFHHNIQSVRVVEVLEDLNLCQETIDGILTHTWGYKPKTPEAQVVQLADKIAYINHDIEDSIRAGIIAESDLPKDCIKYFSSVQSKRLDKMINEIINNSVGKPIVSMSEEGWHYTTKLREWMFKNVYIDSPAKLEEKKARNVIKELFFLYSDMLKPVCEESKIERVVTDYISGMTDRYAVERYQENFIPKGIQNGANEDYLFKLAKIID